MKVRLLASLVLLLCWPALARPTPAAFLDSETEIHRHDQILTEVAVTTESWLAGRKDRAALLKTIESCRSRLGPFREIEQKVAKSVYDDEKQILQRIEAFAADKEPDSDGQKALFLALSRLTESRTRALIRWRQGVLRSLLGADLSPEQHVYYRWELAWMDVWDREAELTSQLEYAFLDGSGPTPEELLKSLLKLRLRADNIACPQSLKALDTTSKERLTLLTRTTEQLLRLKTRRSSGALTRVRRLSRQLSELTQKFQRERLARLESLLQDAG